MTPSLVERNVKHDHLDCKLIGQRAKRMRHAKHLTLETLAENTRLSVRFICYIEAGEKNASLNSLCKIADELDISLRFLMFGD